MKFNGIGDADTRPARWLVPDDYPLVPGEPTALQDTIGLHAMAGMLVAREADLSPEVVDAICEAPAWKTFCSHAMVGLDRDDPLFDMEARLAQHVALTLIERVGEVHVGDQYIPANIALMIFYRGVMEGHGTTQGDVK
jgi:hypothetical protein